MFGEAVTVSSVVSAFISEFAPRQRNGLNKDAKRPKQRNRFQVRSTT